MEQLEWWVLRGLSRWAFGEFLVVSFGGFLVQFCAKMKC